MRSEAAESTNSVWNLHATTVVPVSLDGKGITSRSSRTRWNELYRRNEHKLASLSSTARGEVREMECNERVLSSGR